MPAPVIARTMPSLAKFPQGYLNMVRSHKTALAQLNSTMTMAALNSNGFLLRMRITESWAPPFMKVSRKTLKGSPWEHKTNLELIIDILNFEMSVDWLYGLLFSLVSWGSWRNALSAVVEVAHRFVAQSSGTSAQQWMTWASSLWEVDDLEDDLVMRFGMFTPFFLPKRCPGTRPSHTYVLYTYILHIYIYIYIYEYGLKAFLKWSHHVTSYQSITAVHLTCCWIDAWLSSDLSTTSGCRWWSLCLLAARWLKPSSNSCSQCSPFWENGFISWSALDTN